MMFRYSLLALAVLTVSVSGCPDDSDSSTPQYDNSIFGGGNLPGTTGSEGPSTDLDDTSQFGEKTGDSSEEGTVPDSSGTDSTGGESGTTEPVDGSSGTDAGSSGSDSQVIPQPDVDTYVAVPTDISFEDPDTGCTPSCEGKVCGSDGCGSVCGFLRVRRKRAMRKANVFRSVIR